MNVYFDKEKDIKSISPVKEPQFEAEGYSCAQFDIADVDDFLTAKKNPFHFFVSHKQKNGVDAYKILPKEVEVNYIRSIDNYLSEVKYQPKMKNAIEITNNTIRREITVKINSGVIRAMTNDESEDYTKYEMFRATPRMVFHFTSKDDPSFLVKSVSIVPKQLLDEQYLTIPYAEDLRNRSVFTKKFFNDYSYQEL